nr:DUF6520 family protein [Pedobacter sp. ASV2]
MKKFILPAVVLLMGAGAALATNSSKSAKLVETGYRFDPSAAIKCIATPQTCQPSGVAVCTWNDGTTNHNLSRKVNDTMCGVQLFKP